MPGQVRIISSNRIIFDRLKNPVDFVEVIMIYPSMSGEVETYRVISYLAACQKTVTTPNLYRIKSEIDDKSRTPSVWYA